MSEALRKKFTENAEQFDALMVEMLSINEQQAREIAKLKEERDRAIRQNDIDWVRRQEITRLTQQLAQAKEQLLACQKDAARYRWLRSQHWDTGTLAVVANPKSAVKLGGYCPSLEQLDADIDAAIRKSEG
jgi:uncharacterized protein YhaN